MPQFAVPIQFIADEFREFPISNVKIVNPLFGKTNQLSVSAPND